jgi:DNA polymerase III subunit beta
MKLLCTRENLKKAIFNTERVTGKQTNLPILNNILLETEKGRLKLSATNLEIGIISYIGAKIEKDGKITIPVKVLANFINNLPENEDKINMELEDQILKIYTDGYQAKIKGLDAQDFPIIPKTQNPVSLIISASELKNYIPKLLTCVSLNEARPELSGVCMILEKNKIFLAATDSFRLIEGMIELDSQKQTEEYGRIQEKYPSLIIPANTLSELGRIIDLDVEEVRFYIEEGQLFISIGDVWVVSRLINGKYPDYKQIIPQKSASRTVVIKEDFMRGVRMASGFINAKVGEIVIETNENEKTLTIFAESQEKGENKTSLKVDMTGPSQKVVFNPKFIIDGLGTMDTNQVAIFINSQTSPVSLKMISNDKGEVLEKLNYIAMPIRNN